MIKAHTCQPQNQTSGQGALGKTTPIPTPLLNKTTPLKSFFNENSTSSQTNWRMHYPIFIPSPDSHKSFLFPIQWLWHGDIGIWPKRDGHVAIDPTEHFYTDLASYITSTQEGLGSWWPDFLTFKVNSIFCAGQETRAENPGLSWTFWDSWQVWYCTSIRVRGGTEMCET